MHRSNGHLLTTVELMRFATPALQCVCLQIDELDEAALQLLDLHQYDYAPVLDRDRVIGFASMQACAGAAEIGKKVVERGYHCVATAGFADFGRVTGSA